MTDIQTDKHPIMTIRLTLCDANVTQQTETPIAILCTATGEEVGLTRKSYTAEEAKQTLVSASTEIWRQPASSVLTASV